MTQQHDASYQSVFSDPANVRDLVLDFIPDDWLRELDYETLERLPGTYVSGDFRLHAEDLVWRVEAAGTSMYFYIVIEHQDTIDLYMAVRIMTSVGLLYEDLIRDGQLLADQQLPPVLPIVLYNGDQRWSALPELEPLIAPMPGLAATCRPQIAYLPIDRFSKTVNRNRKLERTLTGWMRAVLLRKGWHDLQLPAVENLTEVRIAMGDQCQAWAEQNMAEGQASVLQELLTLRFGPLPEWTLAKLDAANGESIETWTDRLLDAESLEAVFQA